MKKSGFTLIELIAVIVVLGIVFGVAIPIATGVSGKNQERAYQSSISASEHAADLYDKSKGMPKDWITIGELYDEGYIEEIPIDPTGQNRLNENTKIIYTESTVYDRDYVVVVPTNDHMPTVPIIITNSPLVQEVDVGEYTETGGKAYDTDWSSLPVSYNPEFLDDSTPGTKTVVYTAVGHTAEGEEITVTIEKKVIVY